MSKRKEMVCAILDAFEELLEEKDITIPSEDDEQRDGSSARLYGTEYFRLEEEINSIIGDWEPYHVRGDLASFEKHLSFNGYLSKVDIIEDDFSVGVLYIHRNEIHEVETMMDDYDIIYKELR